MTIGAYTTSVARRRGLARAALPALAAAAVVGAIAGVIVGLPALRLRTFYFAMATLGFATIVTQMALAWTDVTGGGIGIAGPAFAGPVRHPDWVLPASASRSPRFCTWMTLNIAGSRFGRALVGVARRRGCGRGDAASPSRALLIDRVPVQRRTARRSPAGCSPTLQSYITPDAFTFDLSVLFFIAILIGGRGSVLGPLLGTILLTVLPEFAAPLVAWSTFLYAALLLVIVLVAAGRDRRSARSAPPPQAAGGPPDRAAPGRCWPDLIARPMRQPAR